MTEVPEVPDFDALAKLLVYYSLRDGDALQGYSALFTTTNAQFDETFPVDARQSARPIVSTYAKRIFLGTYVYDITTIGLQKWRIVVRKGVA